MDYSKWDKFNYDSDSDSEKKNSSSKAKPVATKKAEKKTGEFDLDNVLKGMHINFLAYSFFYAARLLIF